MSSSSSGGGGLSDLIDYAGLANSGVFYLVVIVVVVVVVVVMTMERANIAMIGGKPS